MGDGSWLEGNLRSFHFNLLRSTIHLNISYRTQIDNQPSPWLPYFNSDDGSGGSEEAALHWLASHGGETEKGRVQLERSQLVIDTRTLLSDYDTLSSPTEMDPVSTERETGWRKVTVEADERTTNERATSTDDTASVIWEEGRGYERDYWLGEERKITHEGPVTDGELAIW